MKGIFQFKIIYVLKVFLLINQINENTKYHQMINS